VRIKRHASFITTSVQPWLNYETISFSSYDVQCPRAFFQTKLRFASFNNFSMLDTFMIRFIHHTLVLQNILRIVRLSMLIDTNRCSSQFLDCSLIPKSIFRIITASFLVVHAVSFCSLSTKIHPPQFIRQAKSGIFVIPSTPAKVAFHEWCNGQHWFNKVWSNSEC